jgi:hypothetical protein
VRLSLVRTRRRYSQTTIDCLHLKAIERPDDRVGDCGGRVYGRKKKEHVLAPVSPMLAL